MKREPRAQTIYALADARGVIRYVGRTCKPLRLRLKAHTYQARRSKWPVSKWVREIGSAMSIVSLEELPGRDKPCGCGQDHLSREKYWIEKLAGDGHDLLNVVHNPNRITGKRGRPIPLVHPYVHASGRMMHLPPRHPATFFGGQTE